MTELIFGCTLKKKIMFGLIIKTYHFLFCTGKTIFFQGLDFWEFYDMKMRTRRGYPKRISQHWLNCPGVAQSVEKKYESLQKNDDHSGGDDEGDVENSADPQNQFSILVLIVACLMYTVSL